MANVDLALDEIISKTHPPPQQRPSGKRVFRTNELFRGGFGRRNSFGGQRFGRPENDNVVWINIANLPDTVLTQDLQELFEDYNVFGIGVHYDEFGAHMGTADLFVDASSAESIMRDFSNVAIDGSPIRFAIVSEQANNSAQFARSRPKNIPINNRRRNRRSNSGRSSRTYSRSRSPLVRERPGRVGGTAVGARNNSQKAKTAEELDRELEQYMRGNKHPRIKLDS